MNPTILFETYTPKQLEVMKKSFKKQMSDFRKMEAQLCKRFELPSLMTVEKTKDIMKMLDEQCKTAWHVYALRKIVFDHNYFPDFMDVRAYAHILRAKVIQPPNFNA